MKLKYFTPSGSLQNSFLLEIKESETFISKGNKQVDYFIINGSISVFGSTYTKDTYISTANSSQIIGKSKISLILCYEEPKNSNGFEKVIKPEEFEWKQNAVTGLKQVELRNYRHKFWIVSLLCGTKIPSHLHPKGEEIYVLEGELLDKSSALKKGSWIRLSANSSHSPYTEKITLILLRNGHL